MKNEGIGQYRGQPLDTSSRRSIRIVQDRHSDETVRDGRLVAEHFYHAGQFWTAVIPIDAIQHVYGQAFNFSRPRMRKNDHGYEIIYDASGMPKRTLRWSNHVQCRFVLDANRPACLFEAERSLNEDPTHWVHDFIYSVEAVGPPGVKFNLGDGWRGNLVCAHRFTSTEEMVFERVVLEGQHITQSAPLDLQPDEKIALLRSSLERSDRAGMTEPYYLLRCCGTNNCTSNPFQILDEVVHYRWWERMAASIYRLPLHPRFYLRIRGLDSEPGHRRMLREEFAEYIAAPETRQRKHAFFKQRKKERKAEQTKANL